MHRQTICWCKVSVVLISFKLIQSCLYNINCLNMLLRELSPFLNHCLISRKDMRKCRGFLLRYNLLKGMWNLNIISMIKA